MELTKDSRSESSVLFSCSSSIVRRGFTGTDVGSEVDVMWVASGGMTILALEPSRQEDKEDPVSREFVMEESNKSFETERYGAKTEEVIRVAKKVVYMTHIPETTCVNIKGVKSN